MLHDLWAAWAEQTSSRWNGFNGRSGEAERGMLINCLTFLCMGRWVLLNEQMKIIICVIISVPTCVKGERLSISAHPSLYCSKTAPLLLSSSFFRVPQTYFFLCGVKSQDGFHLDLQSLTPYSFVSIKILEHSLVLKCFVPLCEPLRLPFYHVTASITFPRETYKTSGDSLLFILADIV